MPVVEYIRGGKRRRMKRVFANVLLKMGVIKIVPDNTYRTRDMRAAPQRAVVEPDETQALREQYQQMFGKRPFMGWDADKLREKLAEGPEAE